MDSDKKQLAVSLIRAVENLLVEIEAMRRLTDAHRIPPHLRKVYVVTMRTDELVATLARARVQSLYEQIEHAADVDEVVESLLVTLHRREQD